MPYFGLACGRLCVALSLLPHNERLHQSWRRVFSLLKLMFGDLQMSALEDMMQAALMLKYNKHKVTVI
jgi:hypothetical protein